MKKIMKKILIASFLLVFAASTYALNVPPKLGVRDLYSSSAVPTLMNDEFGNFDTGVIGYSKVAENDFLALYLNASTSHFAVKDKRNNHTWFSNSTRFDPLARTETQRNLQKSTLMVTYLKFDNTTGTMNNFQFSINYKRDFADAFTIEMIDNGFKVLYRMADREPRGHWFPAYISKERFIELIQTPVFTFGNMTDRRNLEQYYGPMADNEDIYVIRQLTLDEETGMYDMTKLSGAQVATLFKLFYQIGYYGNKKDASDNYIEEYTLEDVEFDNAEHEVFVVTRQPEFEIPIEIKLNEDNLDARINYSGLVEKNGYEIVSIRLLPYFGAADLDKNGYLLIPEGSGGLIRFNNQKTVTASYASSIYGEDVTEIPDTLLQKDVGSMIPIFGLKSNENAMLAVIENGAAHSVVRADVGAKLDSFNKIYNEFVFRQSGTYQLALNKIPIWNKNPYVYSPNVKYYFFAGEKANYTDMAQLYGEYLKHKYRLTLLEEHPLAMHLDLLGSYSYDDFFMWFPVKKTGTLTTFAQATKIVEELKASGVDEQVLRYIGWFNEGIRHSVPNNITLDSELGSRKAFQTFYSKMEGHGYPVHYDVDFVNTYASGAFYTSKNYSRVIGGLPAKFYPYDKATLRANTMLDPHHLSSTAAIDANTTKFEKNFARLGVDGISFRSLGNTLYGDFSINRQVSRIQNVLYFQDIVAKFHSYDIMMANVHDYMLFFVDRIVDLETRSSNLIVADEAVPFYQIAIAKYIPYAMPSFNMYDRYEKDLYVLTALATGSNMKATLSYQNPTVLQDTVFLDYYQTYYESQKAFIIDAYMSLKNAGIDGHHLIRHETISNGFVKVTYSNQKMFWINFNENTMSHEGVDVPGRSFVGTGG